jgi:hypothetical protein
LLFNLNIQWQENENELETKLLVDGKVIMEISEEYYRPAELTYFLVILWKPKVSFNELVKKWLITI